MIERAAGSELRSAIVVTTINPPTEALRKLRDGAPRLAASLYIVGDAKSPVDFALDGAVWMDLACQRRTPSSYARICPTGH